MGSWDVHVTENCVRPVCFCSEFIVKVLLFSQKAMLVNAEMYFGGFCP